jgi:4-amino-4-deoxy-L-arabinose transferase-like glycosyltransferase
MSSGRRDFVLVVALAAVVLVGNLGGAKLWDEDEPRNARCAVEMLERSDLVVPTFNGELRTHKPILLYWLMIGAYQLFGVSEFAARLPSALLGIGTVLCVWASGRRLFGPQVGLISAVIISTALMFDVAGRAATPDSVLIFWMAAALTVFVHAAFASDGSLRRAASAVSSGDGDAESAPVWFPRSAVAFASFYACLGFAMLAKGPVGFLLPMAALGMFLLIVRRSHENRSIPTERPAAWRVAASWFAPGHFLRTLACMRPWTGAVIALAIAVPWYWAVGAATDGEWLRGFFLDHNLGRATSTMESHSGPFLLFYIVAVMVGFFPWSVFLLPSILDARRRYFAERQLPPGIILAACWIGVPVVLFSFASTKLPSYVTPGYPGLALLVGCCLDRVIKGQAYLSLGWLRASLGSSVFVGIALAIGAGIAVLQMFPGEYLLILPGVALAAGSAIGFWKLNRNESGLALRAYAVTSATFVICLFAIAAPRVSRFQEIDSLFASAERPDADFGTCDAFQSSWVFYAGQTLERFHREDPAALRDFLVEQPNRLVVARASEVDQLAVSTGLTLKTIRQIPWFLERKSKQLVLISAEPPAGEPADQIVLTNFETDADPDTSVKLR